MPKLNKFLCVCVFVCVFCFWCDFVLRQDYTLFVQFYFTLEHINVYILYGPFDFLVN